MKTQQFKPKTKSYQSLLEQSRQKTPQILSRFEIRELYASIPRSFPDSPFPKRKAQQVALKVILDLCYGCGLRGSEAQSIQLKDINYENQLIYIKPTKARKGRYLAMSRQILRSIQDYICNYRAYHAPKQSKQLLPFTSIEPIFEHLVQVCSAPILQAKAPNLRMLRHSLATHLLQNGMSIENLSYFLGHDLLQSTKMYKPITIQSLSKASIY